MLQLFFIEMIHLTRKKFLLIAYTIFVLYFLAFKLKFIVGSSFTNGKIVGFTSGYKVLNPTVEFTANGSTYKFCGEASFDDYIDKDVRVVYKNEDPYHAKIFSFFGFWWSGIIIGLIPLTLYSAIVLSFVAKGESVKVDLGKYFKKKQNHPDFNHKIEEHKRKEIE